MSDIRSRFGGARLGGAGPQYKNTKISDKTNGMAFRIFPAMHSLMDAGRWFFFHPVHFGYSVYEDQKIKDPTKLRLRPFRCVEEIDRRTDMVTVSCAECRLIDAQTQAKNDIIETERSRLKGQGILDKEQQDKMIEPLLAPMNKWFSDHNLDKKFYMNAIDLNGDFHVIRMGVRAKQALEAKIKQLREERGIEPIADLDSGVYFRFTVTGKGNQTQTAVDAAKEQDPNDKLSERMKIAPLTDAILEKALQILPDLSTVARVVTPEQVKMLVESGGDPEMVQIVMDMSNRVRNESSRPAQQTTSSAVLPPASTPAVRQSLPVTAAPPVTTTVAPAVTQAAPATPPVTQPVVQAAPAPVVVDEEAEMEKKLAELRARKAAKAAEDAAVAKQNAATVSALPTPSNADPLDPSMSPEQFAAAFGPPPRR